MSGLNTSLSIGLQALDASQAALNATSNNIANANTVGYTQEVPDVTENAETVSGGQVSGGGVTLVGLQSIRDELLNLQIQQQTSAQSSVDTQSSDLAQIQNYFSTSSGGDLASAFTSFASSLTELSASPSSGSVQQSVISAGQNLAQSFNTTSNALTSLQTEADGQVSEAVAQINSLTTQIATLNGQVQTLQAQGQDGGTTEDQRDELVQQLSALTGVSISQSSDGETITTGNGSPLVVGSKAYSLQTVTGTDGFQHVEDATGTDVTSSIQGGTLGGAITVRDQTVPGFLSSLNTLASQFATAFNTAQTQGFDSNGNTGTDFFSLPTGGTGAAAGISVGITNPSQVAVSSDGSAGSNGNVANLSGVLTSNLPSGQTPAGAYSTLVFQVGNAASSTSAESSAISSNLLQLTNQQSSVSGVSIDEETTNLIRYQTSYEAAARIVSTIQQLSTVTLNMGTSGGY
jgi:flagellar hook-associated protein 1 FlgK